MEDSQPKTHQAGLEQSIFVIGTYKGRPLVVIREGDKLYIRLIEPKGVRCAFHAKVLFDLEMRGDQVWGREMDYGVVCDKPAQPNYVPLHKQVWYYLKNDWLRTKIRSQNRTGRLSQRLKPKRYLPYANRIN